MRIVISSFLLFLSLFQHISYAQVSQYPKTARDTLEAIITNKKLVCVNIFDSLRFSPAFPKIVHNTEALNYIKDAFKNRFNIASSDENLRLFTLLEIEGFKMTQEIGKALVAADKYYQAIKSKNNKALLANVYNVYTGIYEYFDMPEERVKYARMAFYIQYTKDASDSAKADAAGAYAWNLTQGGWQLQNFSYIDSAAALMKIKINYQNNHPTDAANKVEMYSQLILTLARLKKHQEIIEIGKEAFDFFDKNKLPAENWLSYYRTFATRMGLAYSGLNNYDSAFYYLNMPYNYNKTKDARSSYYPANGMYCDYPIMVDIINALKIFKKYKEAATLLNIALFSKDKYTNPNLFGFWYERAAPIFEKAGMQKEALICYKEAKIIGDSLQKESDKIQREANQTNLNLQIQAAAETSRLEKEKSLIQTQKEKDEKTIILVSSSIMALLLTVFLLFMYKRFRVERTQKNTIEEQKLEVEIKNKEILDSMQYAKRIQNSLLPSEWYIDKQLKKLNKK